MPGEPWTRSGEEWQKLVARLLSLKFRADGFVPIPDKTNGDCGLEGFTRSGMGFQCYAAEEPLTSGELTKKQKAKVTDDVAKLQKHQGTLKGLLGPTVLTEWVLVVPRWEDKGLLAHAEEKLQAVRNVGLSFVSPSIVPNILTGDDLAVEWQQLMQAGKASLRTTAGTVAQADVAAWAASNDNLITALYRKALTIRHQDAGTAAKLRDESVGHYLRGQNALAELRTDYPDIFEHVDRIKKDRECFLVAESLATPALPPEHWRATRDSLEQELASALPGLDRLTVRVLVHEAVADWLLRCPLDFPGGV